MRFSASVAGTGLSEAELRLKLLSSLPLRPKHRKTKVRDHHTCDIREKKNLCSRIPDPDFYPSQIQKQQQKRGVKKS
jgi:hypothetical protein